MQISIPLPNVPSEQADGGNYEAIKHFLRQVELSVHHAQKSLEEIHKMNSELENPEEIYVTYRAWHFDPDSDGSAKGTISQPEIEFFTM